MSSSTRHCTDDGFEEALAQHFERLAGKMKQPGFAEAVEKALFSGPEVLSQSYRPGTTETQEDCSD